MLTHYNLLTNSILNIRLILNERNFSISSDNLILDSYEELVIFVISNFEIPSSHKEYILKNLKLSKNVSEENMIAELQNNLKDITGNFSLEFPLRALEVYFSYGEEPDDIDIHVLGKLKYLISKLHYLVGENYKFN
ncbi:hypothetical protein IUY40_02760 [Flavobacterium sp. ALJ2]|uniref:hypothetical protein n=1 Tax=Flavobacterium sp. ALJ2 TaxID=2786960 RepID=UPI0018A035A1|nr:hypothetical protein [Flavobacterium sp. ALJ2]MBF7090466.1 hypothetical protein [Flavobacterium sp. ALJ2]